MVGAPWGDMGVELGQIWGKVSDPEALEGCMEYYLYILRSELIKSMPARMQAVIDANGYPTPY